MEGSRARCRKVAIKFAETEKAAQAAPPKHAEKTAFSVLTVPATRWKKEKLPGKKKDEEEKEKKEKKVWHVCGGNHHFYVWVRFYKCYCISYIRIYCTL